MSEEARKVLSKMEDKCAPLYKKIKNIEDEKAFEGVENSISRWDSQKRSSATDAVNQAKQYLKERVGKFHEEVDKIFEKHAPKSFGEYVELKSKRIDEDPIYIEAAPFTVALEKEILVALNSLTNYLQLLESVSLPSFKISTIEGEVLNGLSPFQKEVAKNILERNLCQYSLETLLGHYTVIYRETATKESILAVLEKFSQTSEWELTSMKKDGRPFDYVLRKRGVK